MHARTIGGWLLSGKRHGCRLACPFIPSPFLLLLQCWRHIWGQPVPTSTLCPNTLMILGILLQVRVAASMTGECSSSSYDEYNIIVIEALLFQHYPCKCMARTCSVVGAVPCSYLTICAGTRLAMQGLWPNPPPDRGICDTKLHCQEDTLTEATGVARRGFDWVYDIPIFASEQAVGGIVTSHTFVT